MSTPPIPLNLGGTCDEPFAAVRDAFVENFLAGYEVGAALAVMVRGQLVVDLWAGFADEARTRPWQQNTMVNVYSVTKAWTAICAHVLADRGQLDLDSPVHRYWPGFADFGKDAVTVAQILSHQAGVPAIREGLPEGALYNWTQMVEALARQAPWWTPGSRHGYHSMTFGYLVGEVVRRVSRRSVGRFFREEVAEPLGVDCHIGFGPEHDQRVAELTTPWPATLEQKQRWATMFADPASMLSLAVMNPPVSPGATQTRAWRAAEIPAVNGHGTAHGLARLFGALASDGTIEGVRLLSPEAIRRAVAERSRGLDAVLGVENRFGLGFMLPSPADPIALGERAFGHSGLSGALAFGDPDMRLGFGYVTNQVRYADGRDPRWVRLLESVYRCV